MPVIRRIWIWCRNAILFFLLSTLAAVVAFRFIPVYYTPLMLIRIFEQIGAGQPVVLHHRWIPLEQIAQPLAQAVVASEDNLFMTHHGFDLTQIQKARKEAAEGRRVRGASTISQQTAKNVFLWPGRSYLRKGLEVYFTLLIEWVWSKERIMEVYLNSIEMGHGIYGAQAVAGAHFNKKALLLTPADAALIAATLPDPRRFSSIRPSAYMRKRQGQILSLMQKIERIEMGYGARKRKPEQK